MAAPASRAVGKQRPWRGRSPGRPPRGRCRTSRSASSSSFGRSHAAAARYLLFPQPELSLSMASAAFPVPSLKINQPPRCSPFPLFQAKYHGASRCSSGVGASGHGPEVGRLRALRPDLRLCDICDPSKVDVKVKVALQKTRKFTRTGERDRLYAQQVAKLRA